jgi:GTPase Era involved in 16S rRNA processing
VGGGGEKEYLLDEAPVREWEHDAKTKSDRTPQQIAEQIIRSQLFARLNEEVPYAITQVSK